MDDGLGLSVKRVGVFVPVPLEQLLDAGMPLPPGMQPTPAPKPLSRRMRWRMARAECVWSLRRRVGFWIANYEPDDGDW